VTVDTRSRKAASFLRIGVIGTDGILQLIRRGEQHSATFVRLAGCEHGTAKRQLRPPHATGVGSWFAGLQDANGAIGIAQSLLRALQIQFHKRAP